MEGSSIWNGKELRYFKEPSNGLNEAAYDLSRANRWLTVIEDPKESLDNKQNALQNLIDLSKGQTSVARHAFCFLSKAEKLVKAAEGFPALESSAMAFT